MELVFTRLGGPLEAAGMPLRFERLKGSSDPAASRRWMPRGEFALGAPVQGPAGIIVALGQPGASPVSVRRGTFATD